MRWTCWTARPGTEPGPAGAIRYNAGLRALSQILAKYTAFIWALLRPLGSWGVFGIAFIDAAFLGLPLDPVVAGYIYKDQGRFWLYILMAAAGSALGSSIIYVVGSKGGELVLRRRVSHERVEQLRRRFERQEFVALLVPAMLPPPTPFKLFLLAAAVFQMRFRDYLRTYLRDRRFLSAELVFAVAGLAAEPDVSMKIYRDGDERELRASAMRLQAQISRIVEGQYVAPHGAGASTAKGASTPSNDF